MSSTVIDLRNKHRPGNEGILEWFADPSHVYCGRPNIYRTKVGDAYLSVPPRGTDCKWGNPFKVGKNCTADDCLEKYEAYVRASPELMADLPSLSVKVLGCWCVGTRPTCHALVLARLVDEITTGTGPSE